MAIERATKEMAGRVVAEILSRYPRQSVEGQPKSYINGLVETLWRQPVDTVNDVMAKIPKRCQYVPTVADFVEVMQAFNARQKSIEERPAALPPPERENYDPAMLEQMAKDAIDKGHPFAKYLHPGSKVRSSNVGRWAMDGPEDPKEREIWLAQKERFKRGQLLEVAELPGGGYVTRHGKPGSAIKQHMVDNPEKYSTYDEGEV